MEYHQQILASHGLHLNHHWITIKGHFSLTFLRSFRLPSSLPLLPADIALYLSYLHGNGYSPNTMATYVSAIAAVHKIAGLRTSQLLFLFRRSYRGRIWPGLGVIRGCPSLSRSWWNWSTPCHIFATPAGIAACVPLHAPNGIFCLLASGRNDHF